MSGSFGLFDATSPLCAATDADLLQHYLEAAERHLLDHPWQ
jgi:hypothetical protein